MTTTNDDKLSDDLDSIEAQNKFNQSQTKLLLPILIIPGFMSSALEVQESKAHPSWIGKRVWINLSALGFQSLHGGSALVQNEQLLEITNESFQTGFSQKLHAEYQTQLACKSRWVHHVSLSSDLQTEREGIKVRPLQGLKAVDYLTPGPFTNLLSYVFGPVISSLQSIGYKESINIDAAPYDWRLPPSELERRDGYFTNTMNKVEQLYKRNNEIPVVLLCHSLGCRTAHYFLNFCLHHRGQAWIDRYIHTYMPVGAPHLGAPKALRAMVSGDKMGLDAFLSDEEGLVLGRSFGSGAWLFPGHLPAGAPANAFLRPMGILQLKVSPIDCQVLLQAREGDLSSSRFRLTIEVTINETKKKKVLSAAFTMLPSRGLLLEFPDSFQFAVPLGENGGMPAAIIALHLQERGLPKNEKELRAGVLYSVGFCPMRALLKLICCFIQYTLLLPCTIFRDILGTVREVTVWTADRTVEAAGGYATLASSPPMALHKLFSSTETNAAAVAEVVLVHIQPYQRRASCSSFGELRTASTTMSGQWMPHLSVDRIAAYSPLIQPVANYSLQTAQNLDLYCKDGKSHYRALRGDELLMAEGLDQVLALCRYLYSNDELGPRTVSSMEAPPVRRVKAIYGVNLDTEVGAVYKPATRMLINNHLTSLHVLDASARLVPRASHRVMNGIIFETKTTPFCMDGSTTIRRSGDGTVPYWSLQHVRSWASPTCNVQVNEIEGAEHREILANKKFQALLLDYVQWTVEQS
ncbi:hypothetical protein MPSEU_000569800 [Mayamaea pseudoterrestris]|nr:hypothetical protein MPSEU_000569800 [Mayamaea pseudoterrestris]